MSISPQNSAFISCTKMIILQCLKCQLKVAVNQNDIQGKVKEDLVLDMWRNGQYI